jgi:hypothetical protein
MQRSIAAVVCCLFVVSCGGSRASYWKVAAGQSVAGAECSATPPASTSTSDLLTMVNWELWEGENDRRVLSGTGSSGGMECTLKGSALSCAGTTTSVFSVGTGQLSTKRTTVSSQSITATVSGDLLSGEVKTTQSSSCEGACTGFTPVTCVTTTTFTGFRVVAEFEHQV